MKSKSSMYHEQALKLSGQALTHVNDFGIHQQGATVYAMLAISRAIQELTETLRELQGKDTNE